MDRYLREAWMGIVLADDLDAHMAARDHSPRRAAEPARSGTAITPGRTLPPSIARASEKAHPVLVDPDAIRSFLEGEGYALVRRFEWPVPDAKTILGLTFAQRQAD